METREGHPLGERGIKKIGILSQGLKIESWIIWLSSEVKKGICIYSVSEEIKFLLEKLISFEDMTIF